MHFFENLQTDEINHFFIGKIVLALQVKMPPTHGRIVPDGLHEFIPAFFAIVLGEFFRQNQDNISVHEAGARSCNQASLAKLKDRYVINCDSQNQNISGHFWA